MKELSIWVWILLICILCGGPAIFYALGVIVIWAAVSLIMQKVKAKKQQQKDSEQNKEPT